MADLCFCFTKCLDGSTRFPLCSSQLLSQLGSTQPTISSRATQQLLGGISQARLRGSATQSAQATLLATCPVRLVLQQGRVAQEELAA